MDLSLSEYIFENKKDISISLTMNGLENAYELFRFCVSLCIQGLVLLCGNHIEIDKISMDSIATVQKKLYNAGIQMMIAIEPALSDVPSVDIRTRPPATHISDFALFIHSRKSTYVLTFNIERQRVIQYCHHE